MNERVVAPNPAIADNADAQQQLRFRALRCNGTRKAFRLEVLFWQLLEAAARASGLRLSDYINHAVSEGKGANGASALRVAAAGWVAGRYAELQSKTAPERLLRLVQLAPCACFAIGANRALLSYNQEFADAVRSNMAVGQMPIDVSTARLSLDVPLQRVIELLRSGEKESIDCGYAIHVGTARRIGKARVLLLPAESATILVGFLVS
ncbi:MAG TPA: ribbon-helix-helix domain-containing protein [Afifellaceae bacterium]|nr:ribbon-helix-helix domain-containing protein [Afifellaceae bacterium]